jgi:hypothetical protein
MNGPKRRELAFGFRRTWPYVVIHAIAEFVRGMPARKAGRFAPENSATVEDEARGRRCISRGRVSYGTNPRTMKKPVAQ